MWFHNTRTSKTMVANRLAILAGCTLAVLVCTGCPQQAPPDASQAPTPEPGRQQRTQARQAEALLNNVMAFIRARAQGQQVPYRQV